MVTRPQTGLANLPLLACVGLTFVFTANVLLQVHITHYITHWSILLILSMAQKLLGSFITGVYLRLGLAFGLGVASMVGVSLFTSLGSDIIASFRN